MASKTRNIVQVFLVVAFVAAGIRLALIMHERSGGAAKEETAAPPLNPEAYVVPKKLYISSLKSAQQLVGQVVWVKEGYRYSVYPYANDSVDFNQPAGMLLPLQKLTITKVATAAVSGQRSRQVVVVFQENGKDYAVPIGIEEGGNVTVYADEMFFYEDPHALYSFWPQQTWQAIEKHQVEKGMNEIQVAFAIGMGVPEPGGGQAMKTVNYPNGGKAVTVTYNNGRAVDIKNAS